MNNRLHFFLSAGVIWRILVELTLLILFLARPWYPQYKISCLAHFTSFMRTCQVTLAKEFPEVLCRFFPDPDPFTMIYCNLFLAAHCPQL